MKTAIVYYSLEGSTKYIAENLASLFGADIISLQPKKEIAKTGFMRYIWGGKQVMTKEVVELEAYDFDVEKYDTIIVGTPVWAFTFSPAIRSFFLKNTLSGKKVAFFCCHEGGPKNTLEDMKNASSATEILGKKDFCRVFARKTEVLEEVKNWSEELKEHMN